MKNSNKISLLIKFIAFVSVIFILVMALLLAGCARGGGISETPEPSMTPEPSPSPAPASGGKLRCPIPENIHVKNEDYNPLLIYTEEGLQLFSLVYEPLISIDETNMLTPSLAVNWAPDASVQNAWIVNLRENAKWHTGETLTSGDVVYTYNVLKTLGSRSYYGSCLGEIVNMEVLTESSIRVLMKDPGFIALYSLTFPIIKENSQLLTGTGAYRALSVTDDRIILTANSDWWDRPPYIKTVEFLARSSNDTALASYSAGQLDFVPTAKLTVGQYSEAGVTAVKDIMTQDMETLLFNYKKSAVKNADFRKAIAHALNRNPIITNVYMNRARKSDVPFPPDSWLYDTNSALYDYDIKLSESILEELGYSKNADGKLINGAAAVTLRLLTSSTTDNVTRSDAAKLIIAQLNALGIDTELIAAEHNYGENESEFLKLLKDGDWDIALVGFNLMRSNELFKYLSPNGSNNFGGFSDIDTDVLIQNMSLAPDEESLRAAAYELQQKFVDELPFIVLYFRLNSVVYDADIKGVSDMREPNIVRNIKNWYLKTAQP